MNRLNQVLAALLLIQGVLIASVGIGREEVRLKAAQLVFPDLKIDAVNEVTVEGPEGIGDSGSTRVTLKKSGDQWVVSSAGDYPAEKEKITKLLENVAKLKARGSVVESASYHKKLEVADSKYQRKVTLGGSAEAQFILGSSPGFKKVHLRLPGANDVMLVDGVSTYDVGTRGSDWVAREYVKIEDKDLWVVEVQNKQGNIRAEKDITSGKWAAAGVEVATGKQAVLDDLIRRASKMNLEAPVGKTEKPEYGLAAPLATVSMVTGTSTIAGAPPQTTETVTLKIGAASADDKRHYVKASTSEFIIEAPKWAVQDLVNKGPNDLKE